MNMNPMLLMQMQQKFATFQKEHPKVLPFFKAVGNQALKEGSIIDVKVTTPEGENLESNIKLTANDIETFTMLMNMNQNS